MTNLSRFAALFLFVFFTPTIGFSSETRNGSPLNVHQYAVLSASEGMDLPIIDQEDNALANVRGFYFHITWNQFTSISDDTKWESLRRCLDFCAIRGWNCIPVIELDPQFPDLADPSRNAGLIKSFHNLRDQFLGKKPEQIILSLDTFPEGEIPTQNPHLLKSFRRHLQRYYHDLDILNLSWSTSFTSWTQIDSVAKSVDSAHRDRDLAAWKKAMLREWINNCFKEARKQFPKSRLNLRLRAGLDANVLVDAAARWKAVIQITCDNSRYAKQFASTRPLLTAARVHKVDCMLVLPMDTDPGVINCVLFNALSSGILDIIYEFNINKTASPTPRIIPEQILQQIAASTEGTRVAVLSTHPNPEYEQRLAQLRDITDYDCLDEELILHGALKHYDVLIAVQADSVSRSTLRRIERFARSGGIVFYPGFMGPLTDLSGTDREFVKIFKSDPPETDATRHSDLMDRRKAGEILGIGLKRVQHGTSVHFPAQQGDFPAYLEFIRLCLFGHVRMADFIPLRDPGDEYDGLYWTCIGNCAILYFNESVTDRVIRIYPAGRAQLLAIPAGTIMAAEY